MIRPVLIAALALASAAPLAARAQDAAAGETVFKRACAVCHSPQAGRNMIGPSLHGIYGRPSSQVTGFRYSEANKKANLTFDAETLERYLADPRAVVPGTTMAYAGLKDPDQRRNLIAYLQTLR
jgi:cytochrome c